MAEQGGNERGSAISDRSSRPECALPRRRAFGLCLAVLAALGLGACEDSPSAREWPPGTLVAIDDIPVSSDEMAQAVAAVILVEPQWGEAQLKRLAFNEISLPCALSRALSSKKAREAARRSIDEQFARIQGGTLTGPPRPSGALGQELTGSWQEIGLLAWGTAMNLEPGAWSEVIEVPGAFMRVRLLSRSDELIPARARLCLDSIMASYLDEDGAVIDDDAEMRKHRLTIVDPAWETIIPERTKYLMGVHQP